ncbi:MAG: hypothetical protein BWY71_00899 [Planctomycetes bacterium ADurb.Bin412]|nr:MAG: hypothetical protein BWY71_00899 [Planctomycetes bacterium ADurb.Bin412]
MTGVRIMLMPIHPFDINVFSVYQQISISYFHRTKSDIGRNCLFRLPVYLKFQDQFIQVRDFRRPQPGLGQRSFQLKGILLRRWCQLAARLFQRQYDLSVLVKKVGENTYPICRGIIITNQIPANV